MKRNMGVVDRLFRVVVVAPVLIALSFGVFGAWSVLGVVALVLAGVMVVTAAIGFCPTYTLFGITTDHGLHHTSSRIVPQH